MHSKLYIPARSATPPYTVDITPESAGWSETSLQVVELDSMQELALDTNGTEVMILPLAGGGTVECGNEAFELSPRASVFDGPADMVYIGTGQSYTLCGEGKICDLRSARRATAAQPQGGWLPTSPSSCAAPATAAARSTTSARQAFSRPTR